VNLKRVVWHDGFLKLLETIILYAKTGYAHLCSDGIVRWLYAFILLLSADYEEQYICYSFDDDNILISRY